MTNDSPSATSNLDVIIIGAGINGAGIARDAAMRGLKVLLIDKGDIGSGTSSWSTRLIHGGLRYLEHREFALVRESLRERETLLRIAPHLVRPLPILIPIYEGSRRGRLTIRLGMIAYDLLSMNKSLTSHRMLSRVETLTEVPGLNPEGLKGAALYYDAQVEFAERLVLENVMAAKINGAAVVTYGRVNQLLIENERVSGVEFVAEHTGARHLVSAAIVVNAAGPWVDKLLEQTPVKTSRLIGGTKGSHIIVPPFTGAPASAVYVEAHTDGRPFFIIPWNGNYLIGTTDIRFEDDLDQVHCEKWEVDYLLAETNRVFPESRLTRSDVLFTYAGVRPLPFTVKEAERGITRRHFVRTHPQLKNLFSIVGGKLTTYRSLAEQCVDLIFQALGQASPRCDTAETPLPGGENFSSLVETVLSDCAFPARVNNRLLRIYGTRAGEIRQLCLRNEALAKTFNKAGDALAGEIVFAFENELAETLTDCLLRRTMLGLNSDLAIGDDERAAEIGKQFLAWSDERVAREVAEYRDSLAMRSVP